ncbi:uncharacterized protein LOC129927152 [Biomphalaria glabrata]|uniref:Uncharacterized protein LOC129927152 n=1 Tax=Biomphalaria glabrata TaxID=6526 RepID=A0A9W3AT35_BIOGL|nr:uncharacterized protein LOC129927152 [Biomphalaria glabrata]
MYTLLLDNDGVSDIPRRLRNFDIDIFQQDPRQLANFPNITGNLCYHQTSSAGNETYLYNCTAPVVGRYIRLIVRLSNINYLHVCEIEVLVSGSRFEESYFNKKANTQLTETPLDTLVVNSQNDCLQECLGRRSSTYCTAFNWVTSSRSCQLFSVNPFLDLTGKLTSVVGTHFYSEYNLLL